MQKIAQVRKAPLALALAMLLMVVLGALNFGRSSAAQITARSLTMSDNRIYNAGPPVRGDSVNYTFTFTIPTTGNIGSMQFDFCTNAIGTCTAWSGTTSSATFTSSTISGFSLGTQTASRVRITRTPASVSSASYNVILAGVRNPNATCNGSVNACTFYVQMTTFSDAAYTTAVDTGTVAASVNNQTTVSFRVQEILDFCVGTLRNGAGGTGGGSIITPANFASTNFTANNLTDCDGSGIGSPSIDLGIASPTTVRSSPVATTAGIEGSDNYGMAMLSTNAANTTTVGYRAVQDTSSGELKVAGATCNANPSTLTTDQCVNSVGTAGNSAAITTAGGTEGFGMTVPAVNNSSSSRATSVLTRAADYQGNGNGTGGSCTANAGDCWLWLPAAGANDTIATASGAVDFEAIMLDFAAKAALTTPPGQYVVNIDFYAVSSY
jgi:hypothetical protein